MAKYLLSVIHPYNAADMPSEPDDEMLEAFKAVDEFNTRLEEDGHWVFAGGLTPIDDARVAHTAPTGDGATMTDGPYLETKEHLGGFWVVEADPDEIDQIALDAAAACRNDVEVRPFQPDAG